MDRPRHTSQRTVLHRLTIMMAVFVVGLGAYTRLKHAGLGCPDWPRCYQNWIVHQNITSPALTPDASTKAWIEMAHRYAAGTLCLLMLALKIHSHKNQNRTRSLFLNMALGITVIQALFGMWTVTWKLHPLAVMPHLIGGMSITTLLYLSMKKIAPQTINASLPKSITTITTTLWIALVFQIILGGWTSANYAALVCPDLPTCQGQWLTSLQHFMEGFQAPFGHHSYEGGVLSGEARIAIHIAHRIGAVICSLLVTMLVVQVFRHRKRITPRMINMTQTLVILFSLQIILGVLNIVLVLPLPNAVAHNVAALLLLMHTSRMWQYTQACQKISTTNTNTMALNFASTAL
jgi:cytochrome c oxidase assembly protein subunit 15